MVGEVDTKAVRVGVVGLGLMGSSIVVALLAAGHRVVAMAPIPDEKNSAAHHIGDLLRHAAAAGLLPRGMTPCIDALVLVEDYASLSTCNLVLECVVEDKEIKRSVYEQIAASVQPETIIASNTSAIPISELQALIAHPQRFLGIHWAEPAYMTRFLEVTCGGQTDTRVAEYVMQLAVAWGKEPTLLKKDIRGFITNRLMYAVYREAFSLVEAGDTTLADVDKAFRYDVGAWITLMGVFRRMDLMGLEDYARAFQRIFKQLNNTNEVPALMQQIIERQGRGVHNQIGLYPYTEDDARAWEAAFAQFNRAIHELAARYNERNLNLEQTEEVSS